MRCPHLEKDVIYTCCSGEGPTLPGAAALRKYCKDDKYHGCPHYKSRAGSAYGIGLESAA